MNITNASRVRDGNFMGSNCYTLRGPWICNLLTGNLRLIDHAIPFGDIRCHEITRCFRRI